MKLELNVIVRFTAQNTVTLKHKELTLRVLNVWLTKSGRNFGKKKL